MRTAQRCKRGHALAATGHCHEYGTLISSGQKTRARRSLPGPDAGHPLQGNAGSAGLSGFFVTLLKLTVVNVADRDMIAPTVTISQCRAACAAAQGLSR
jgi:hypothetical protein